MRFIAAAFVVAKQIINKTNQRSIDKSMDKWIVEYSFNRKTLHSGHEFC